MIMADIRERQLSKSIELLNTRIEVFCVKVLNQNFMSVKSILDN